VRSAFSASGLPSESARRYHWAATTTSPRMPQPCITKPPSTLRA
jgi:hypothetical protein